MPKNFQKLLNCYPDTPKGMGTLRQFKKLGVLAHIHSCIHKSLLSCMAHVFNSHIH